MAREYRVKWKREGQYRKRKLYQTRKGAEEFMRHALTGEDRSDGYYAEREPEQFARMTAPFTEGPTLEAREVGEWEPIERGAAHV